MNVIISNLNGNKFVNLDIDVIKSITGEFTADEIVQTFSNFFFNRMFLDITAIQDYKNVNTLRKLSIGLDVSKIILLISDDYFVGSDIYISNLISMGFYNIARTEEELMYLYNNPNSYKDVAHLHRIDSNLNTDLVSEKFDNVGDTRVIGIKNFTNHAGATSLIYMLKKVLSNNYYTVAVEVNKRDFIFFNDKDMVSCNSSELSNVLIRYNNANIILIDLNDLEMTNVYNICKDVIYLMESSTLMINKAVMLDNKCFSKINGEKVILNRSLLNSKDIARLEFESGIHFFGIIPPLNDRIDNSNVLIPILANLGLYKKLD